MPHLIIVETIQAVPGKGAELKQALLEMVPISRRETGCLQYEIAQASDGAETFLALMRWESSEHFAAHCTSPDMQEFVRQYENVLYAGFEEQVWLAC